MASNEQHKGHFYFDTDSVALKNNAECVKTLCKLCANISFVPYSYQSLLKTLAILEAQKCQAIKVVYDVSVVTFEALTPWFAGS